MNRSRPTGALGGGGWEADPLPGHTVTGQSSSRTRKDKVLADMYEMFLDTLEAEVIECVVESCKFNHKKSMDALMELAGTSHHTTQSSPSPSKGNSFTHTQETRISLEQAPQIVSMPSQQNLCSGDETVLSPKSPFRQVEKKPILSSWNPLQVENKPLPQPVDGYGRQRNSPGPPAVNNYFPARKKKTENSSGNEIAQFRWYIENDFRIMVLMRGCPGSGKSYLAKGLVLSYAGDPKDFIFSTDDYFIKNNIYKFDPMSLNDAHLWNQRRCLSNAREGRSPIIIDNTNTQLWEMTVYANIAVNHGYSIVILEPDTPWAQNLNELAKRNQHGVPKDKIRVMLERYEKGITVERLLLSTGLKYTKPPPQRAEQSLTKLVTAKHARRPLLKSETQSNNHIFSPKSTFKKSEEQENMSSGVIPGGFYFGPNTFKRLDFIPSNSVNEEMKDLSERTKEKSTKLFSEDFKTGSVPLKDEDQNIHLPMCKEESDANGTNTKFEDSGTKVKMELTVNNKLKNESNLLPPNFLEDKFQSTIESVECEVPSQATNESNKPTNIPGDEEKNDSLKNEVLSCNSTNTELITSQGVCDSILGSGDGLHSKSMMESKVNSTENYDNTKEEAAAKSSNAVIRLSSLSDLLADDSSRWSGSPERVSRERVAQIESVYQNSVAKPPRSFSMKNIQDYCNSVKDMNAASENEASNYSFSENSAVSWQPIEAEVFQQEKSYSPSNVPLNTQRSKFKKLDVSEKGTNTNHTDFCLLSNDLSSPLEDGMRVLNTFDRDINEGRIMPSSKVSLKLMLDKGTYTENDFEGEPKSKSKHEKIKELVRLFPNRSTASIKELLKQCDWDLNYVSNILLDDTDNPVASFVSDENNDGDSEVESSSDEQEAEDSEAEKESKPASNDIPISENTLATRNLQEEAEEVKRHIEQSFDFNERCYSPHTLAIKNLRRGKREGAIPKTPSMSLGEAETLSVESPQEASDSDEGETLEFIVGKDFMQQLMDKFGRPNFKGKDMSPVVKFPVNLARQIYDVILSTINSEDEEDDGDFAMKLQCEEDERMARQLYEEMLRNTGHSVDSSPPPLREIMDMELAQAIYKADIDSLTQNSPDTIANVLAKRLLEENYSHIDKKTLHDIFAACNCSFEDTVKTLQHALSPDEAERKQKAMAQQVAVQDRQKLHNENAQGLDTEKPSSIENSIGIENPWELSDPKDAYNKYREKADEFLKERDEMYRKANEAFRRKERSVAAYYSKLGEVHGKKFHHASAMAAAALAAAHTDLHSSDTLDLHHFKVVEAVTVFDLFMDYHIRILPENGLQQRGLDIITGRGTHSVNGRPRIKPAISNRAKKRNLRCQQVPGNPGVLKIWVTSNSFLSHEVPE